MSELPILILAPLGRDGPLAQQALREAGIACELCPSMEALAKRCGEDAGGVIVTEEALTPQARAVFEGALEAQPAWSDLPVIVFGAREVTFGRAASVTLLGRPVPRRTLLSACTSALRARTRQHEVRDLLAQLEQSVRDRDQFLAMLGHELRNPLAAILTSSELLDREAPGQFVRERAIIGRQARRLARLVDDLLDVSRVTRGNIRLRRDPVELGELVQRTVAAFEDAARAHKVSLSLRASRGARLQGDALRLEQIAGNLIGNAIKYTPEGGRVEVEVDEEGGDAVLRVRDTGVGIAGDMLPRVFDLFVQSPGTIDRAQGGMGIGLTLVRRLAELHGGSVTAVSAGQGAGATFEVRLPRGDAQPAAPRAIAQPKRAGLRVMLVEDNADARETLQIGLEMLGHVIDPCADGLYAITRARDFPPDAMLIDLGLPGRDGFEVARAVRGALGSAVRLVALTGYGQPEDERRAREAGFDAFLTKPADLDTLDRAIHAN